jgi:hypothetical protein
MANLAVARAEDDVAFSQLNDKAKINHSTAEV